MNKRIIKFRIWDSMEKSWLNCKNPLNVVFFPSLIQGQIDIDEIFNFESNPKNRYAVQQFTGLSDKNNKEIYEGDICLIEYYSSAQNGYVKNKDVICFEKGSFVAKCFELYDKENRVGFLLPYQSKIEIIGNIFENQDLIK